MADGLKRGRVVESLDRFVIEEQGMSVTQCRFDFALSLVFAGDAIEGHVVISSSFRMNSRGASPITLVPAGDPSAMAPALTLAHRPIHRMTALKTGELRIELEDVEVDVPASGEYEAWNLWLSDQFRLVSLPGGELAVWKADD